MVGKYAHSVLGMNPVLLEMPHSGQIGLENLNNVPPVIARKIRFDLRSVRRTIGFGCDAAVPEMSGFNRLVKHLRLSAIYNDLARVYCDTNRAVDDVSGLALQGKEPDKYHHGVIWARTVPTDMDFTLSPDQLKLAVELLSSRMLVSPLKKEDFDTLMNEVYHPYHNRLRDLHEMLVSRHGICIHLALHSLPAREVTMINGGYVCGQKAARGNSDISDKNILKTLPDVILIHNDFAAADEIFVGAVRKAFESAGLIVEDGKGPFLGDKGVTKLYGRNGVHVIGIEHVTHDIEPARHLGSTYVETKLARELQPAYEQAVINILNL